jgi:hypothetical protein
MKYKKLAIRMAGTGLLFLAAIGQTPAIADKPASAIDDAADAALFKKVCTACHLASQATSESKSANQWAQTLDKMITYGAKISDDEYYRITDYMTRHHGLETKQTAAGNENSSDSPPRGNEEHAS